MKTLRSHLKRQGPAELPDPCLEKERAPFVTVVGQKVSAQGCQGVHKGI